MTELSKLFRKNILSLKPYSSARDEFSGSASVFLDANENPFNYPYNRYPDPLQNELKNKISKIKGIDSDSIFLGNGSDEPIDLLFRAFCDPGKDNVVSIEPTYGMYRVAADVNNIEVKSALLNDDYSLNTSNVWSAVNENTKMIFLCSPNNPTANTFESDKILEVLNVFGGIVVLDEAYIDFCPQKTFLPLLRKFKKLVILQTFSKAWGMAGVRLGMCFADKEIISILNKIKYPYNINILTQQKAAELLEQENRMKEWVEIILKERDRVKTALENIAITKKVYPSDANFLLVKVENADLTYNLLMKHSVIVRNRSKISLCGNCLRITIGTPDENNELLKVLKNI